ncbi:multiple coagulation factor deficiency protein 2 homolog isoform X2 [Pectinophora gossypiella]|uniref:multiple coagulation factor deficiency protein 2 homolog isoform X2 n=1 Tax=Pectinophora gossypiella TaxID=13191 RepID=UPI00214E720C|nr:multiple coagulation factor deficiency protein 2 homolog isoform X2 [Pectinophora gossypiella]
MLKLVFLAAFLQCSIGQQYQQKVAPGVPPQNYQEGNNPQNYQPPPPPPQHMQQQQPPQQQYQPPPPQQQQYQPPPQQQYQQQVPVQQQPPQQHGHGHHGDPQLLSPANMDHEKEHIQEHMEVPIDVSKMSQQELQFHYFKMHDADNNNKLDGCELIKSLIHWHEQGHKQQPQQGTPPVGEKIFTDEELVNLIDPILNMDDHNKDGYIDYPEFVRAQQKSQQQEQGK